MTDATSCRTTLPGGVASLAGCVEACLAGDWVIIDVEVTVVDHVITLVVIGRAVDSPEAGVITNPACLPHALRGELAGS